MIDAYNFRLRFQFEKIILINVFFFKENIRYLINILT